MKKLLVYFIMANLILSNVACTDFIVSEAAEIVDENSEEQTDQITQNEEATSEDNNDMDGVADEDNDVTENNNSNEQAEASDINDSDSADTESSDDIQATDADIEEVFITMDSDETQQAMEQVLAEMSSEKSESLDSIIGLSEEELLDGYVEGLFYPDEKTEDGYPLLGAAYGTASTSRLSGYGVTVYQKLRSAVKQIAAGSRQNTDNIELIFSRSTWYTVYDQLQYIMSYLFVDCPFDMYWWGRGMGVRGHESGDNLVMYFYFSVASDYQGSGAYTVNASKVTTAQKAAENARSIASQATGSDYNKLKFFGDTICSLASYNNDFYSYAASKNFEGVDLADPFQLVWVFDNDDSTSVVCEGYAKAFQYLCDNTALSHAKSRHVTGYMNVYSDGNGHAWNIVEYNGQNYIVDLTNADDGDTMNMDLFMTGATGSVYYGYSVTTGGNTLTYYYDDDALSIYTVSQLTLASTATGSADSGTSSSYVDTSEAEADSNPYTGGDAIGSLSTSTSTSATTSASSSSKSSGSKKKSTKKSTKKKSTKKKSTKKKSTKKKASKKKTTKKKSIKKK